MEIKKNNWILDSGSWVVDSNKNYVLSDLKNANNLSEQDRILFKQVHRSWLDRRTNAIFPPEFKFHPETGVELDRYAQFKAKDAWVAPHGQTVYAENQNRKDNGLQYSHQLKILKNKAQAASEKAQTEIPFSFSGSMEFFSICIGTETPQLIAINKNSGDIYLLLESSKVWEKLNATSSLLDCCPADWQDYWGIESFYDATQKKHILLLPTKRGLAELSIDGRQLEYTVNYHYYSGQCLGKPVYWNNCVYIPINYEGQVKIWNYTEKSYIELSGENFIQCFYYVVFDHRHLIWLSAQGKCSLSLDTDKQVSAKFDRWLPDYQPDFNFGSPFMDKEGDFYQLFFKNSDDTYIYLRLNSGSIVEKITSSPRFSTGSTAYDFEEKISHRKNKANIWDTAKKHEHSELFVPLMEDQNQDKDLVLGICFKNIGSKSRESILNDTSKQLISLFIDTPNDSVHHFYSGQFSEPIKKSRFFYHQNYLYFYHPELSELQGWEVQV